jgi:superfamily II RNA helicase
MLFATETFAIGVNMPTKTALFTGVTKFDGNDFRNLLSHEYTQMAGRAGRRGMDKVGHVIHLVNMYKELPTLQEYKDMLGGVPQTLISKFEIDFSLILRQLNLVSLGSENGDNYKDRIKMFIQQSMITGELQKEFNGIQSQVDRSLKSIEDLEVKLTDLSVEEDVYNKYKNLLSTLEYAKNKKKKRSENEMNAMEMEYPTLKKFHQTQEELLLASDELENFQRQLEDSTFFIDDRIASGIRILTDNGFIADDNDNGDALNAETVDQVTLTQKGVVASQLQELNSLAFSEVLLDEAKMLNELSVSELTAVLSGFVSLRVQEEHRAHGCMCTNDNVYNVMKDLSWYVFVLIFTRITI